MKKKPELHDFVKHTTSKLKAQVCQHFTDNDECVKVIVLPQAGFSCGNNRYQNWRIDELEAV